MLVDPIVPECCHHSVNDVIVPAGPEMGRHYDWQDCSPRYGVVIG
jgi:hypothetical protein